MKQTKERRITFVTTPKEYEQIKTLAGHEPVGSYIRRILLSAKSGKQGA